MWAGVGMQKMKPTSVSKGVVRVLSRRDRGEKQRLQNTTLCTPQNGWIILLAVCPLWWEVSLIHILPRMHGSAYIMYRRKSCGHNACIHTIDQSRGKTTEST